MHSWTPACRSLPTAICACCAPSESPICRVLGKGFSTSLQTPLSSSWGGGHIHHMPRSPFRAACFGTVCIVSIEMVAIMDAVFWASYSCNKLNCQQVNYGWNNRLGPSLLKPGMAMCARAMRPQFKKQVHRQAVCPCGVHNIRISRPETTHTCAYIHSSNLYDIGSWASISPFGLAVS